MNKATDNKTREQWMDWLKSFKNHKYELTVDECLALRNAIISFCSVAEEFFFHILTPMCKGFARKIYDTYNVSVDIRDIATWTYVGIYDGGKWTRLKSYRGEQSLFAWIANCASQIVFKELEDQHLIEKSIELNAKNTSLTLRSMHNVDEIRIVVELVKIPQLHQLLTLLYVYRLEENEVMKIMQMSEILYKKSVKAAETILKESLIAEHMMLVEREDGTLVNLVTEALSDLSGTLKTNTSQKAMLLADKLIFIDSDFNEVHEVLQQFYPSLPFMEQWMLFVLDRAAEMEWSEEDETVFLERFYYHTSPIALAKRLGRARSWIDNKYSKQQRALVTYIKRWWKVYEKY